MEEAIATLAGAALFLLGIGIGSALAHISHINPAGLAVFSNRTTRCSRIAEHCSYHEC